MMGTMDGQPGRRTVTVAVVTPTGMDDRATTIRVTPDGGDPVLIDLGDVSALSAPELEARLVAAARSAGCGPRTDAP